MFKYHIEVVLRINEQLTLFAVTKWLHLQPNSSTLWS